MGGMPEDQASALLPDLNETRALHEFALVAIDPEPCGGGFAGVE